MVRSLLAALAALPLVSSCQEALAPSSGSTATSFIGNSTAAATSAPLSVMLDSMHLDARAVRFHVDKSERRFHVLVGDSLLKTYPCVLGEKPVGDKFHQGDRKTPEGCYTFRSKRVHASWHKFIWVDFPNAESHRRFRERKAAGLIPAGKDIGGEIGIHGVPDGLDHWIDAGQDWTWGCIALKNADIDEIYPYIIAGKTMMEVVP